jgi:predicted aminopeptidase
MKFRFFLKILSDLIFIPLVIFCMLNVSLVIYGLRMGKGQLHIVMNARPVSEVLADRSVPDSVKTKLKLIDEIREFAFTKIGLKRSENYTTFYDQHGQRIIYVVTACKPFALEPHQWHFPVLGDVPYKGFFNADEAKIEEAKLKSQGLDADIGGASGWSTLGFFKDPVLSQMLDNNEGELAELIIHELTHGTIYVKGDAEYNENLASFVGFKGAVLFLKEKYGEHSNELIAYLEEKKEEKTLDDFMLNCSRSLDSLYKSFPAQWNSVQKTYQKKKMFASFVADSKYLPLEMDSLFPKRLEKRIAGSGNAFFMQYVRYGAKQHDFETEFEKFKSDLKIYVDDLKNRYEE